MMADPWTSLHALCQVGVVLGLQTSVVVLATMLMAREVRSRGPVVVCTAYRTGIAGVLALAAAAVLPVQPLSHLVQVTVPRRAAPVTLDLLVPGLPPDRVGAASGPSRTAPVARSTVRLATPRLPTSGIGLAGAVWGAGAAMGLLCPSISADGRFVAFVSSASNLVPGDAGGRLDVFVRALAADRGP